MKTTQELMEERDRLKNELIAVEKELARHPDTIKAAFKHNPFWDMDEFEKLVERISFIRWNTGTEISCTVQFDDAVYKLIEDYGILHYGPINHEELLDRSFIEALWDADDPIKFLKDANVEDAMVVGYLLTLGQH